MLISIIEQAERKTEEPGTRREERVQYAAATTAEEQGAVGLISWLKSIRLEKLLHEMEQIDFRKTSALEELKALTKSVEELIVSNRGGDKGIHGFIGERAQVYITNAWALFRGSARISELIDDNGMIDYWENGIAVQQKACRYKLGLPHLLEHKAKYPTYKGIGQIPKDFYEIYKRLEKLTQAEAGKLRRPDRKIWEEIQKVKAEGIIVKPMKLTYSEIQKDRIMGTIDEHQQKIEREARRQETRAAEKHRATVSEAAKTIAASAVAEGLMTGTVEILNKRHEGKRLKDFNQSDAKDIGKAVLKGSGKGAVRGAVVYTATNFTHIPAPVAGAAVSVVFDGVSAVSKYAGGRVTGAECAAEIGKSTLLASAGAIGAKLGRKFIPIPIVGEAVGGFIFSFAADKGYGWLNRLLANSRSALVEPCCA